MLSTKKLELFILICVQLESISSLKSVNPIVDTRFGQIQGSFGSFGNLSYETFLGIPYAEPPVENLRFQLPRPFNVTWSSPYQAINFGDGCMQNPSEEWNLNISEDCLYLNIWRPGRYDEKELLPVYYFIHGSGYIRSSASIPTNQGDFLAATQEIIVVNSNYRLGAFGFAYGSDEKMPGNLGIYDALAVLRWIHENIKSFGGDPYRVTLAGQSAGSKMVSIIASLPSEFETSKLFSRMIMMSGAATNIIHAESAAIALSKTRLLASKVNCLSKVDRHIESSQLSDETISCLARIPANDILEAQNSKEINALGSSEISVFLPVYGTDLLPNPPMINHIKQSDAIKDVPMLFGGEQDEASMFSPVEGVFTMQDAYSFTNERLSFAIKNITKDQTDIIFKVYFDDADPSNSLDIRSKCIKLASDMNYHCPSLILSEFFSKWSNDIHYYLNSYVGEKLAVTPGRKYGTQHGDDVVFALGTPFRKFDDYTSNDRQFSQILSRIFGDFVKGAPIEDWPSIQLNENDYGSLQLIKEVSLKPKDVVDHEQNICEEWAKLFNYSIPQGNN